MPWRSPVQELAWTASTEPGIAAWIGRLAGIASDGLSIEHLLDTEVSLSFELVD